jgi:alpha-1,3/alpha-1,6-mannosyltransferase
MVRVVFLHPDLGIGGAERLIVDCSLALQAKGHQTLIITAHHDRGHCFQETVSGQCEVLSVGDWLPRAVFGRCQALFATIRMVYITLYMLLTQVADVVIVDQVSTPLPLLRATNHPTIFYCHYPDLLLSTGRKSLLKNLYRAPLDWLEQTTTGMAGTVLVNSQFTRGVFTDTFTSLSHVEPQVLYPSLATHMFEVEGSRPGSLEGDMVTFLSINRFERKKNIGLAIRAFARLGNVRARLVVAGGYDNRVLENVEHYKELVSLAEEKGVEDKIVFLKSPSDQEKVWLLKNCDCLVYTPAGEHFGIVPLEGMFCETPVLAVNSGGPRETVVHGVTGWLCEGDPEQFGEVMMAVVDGEKELEKMGVAGKERVEDHFSFEAFTERLDEYVVDAAVRASEDMDGDEGGTTIFTKFALAFHFSLAMLVLFWMVFYTPLP